MSIEKFVLPDLGEGLAEAEVVRWLVAVGDDIAVDQPVAEVETAKAVVEVPSPYAGRVAALHGDEGSVVTVGTPLLSVETVGGAAAAVEEYREEERAGAGPSTAPSSGSGSGNVLVGYGTTATTTRRRGRRRGRDGAPAPASAPSSGPSAGPSATPVNGRPLVISPVVRKLARERGLDLHALAGTGPGGLIRRVDVERATGAAVTTVGAGRAGVGVGVGVEVGGGEAGVRARVPLTGVRGAVAELTARSRREIPEATTWVDVDVTRLVELRTRLAASRAGSVSLVALLGRAVVAGLERYPELNSVVDVTAREVVHLASVHLGFAAQTDRGLVVPVVHDAHRMTARELDAEVRRLTEAARAGSLSPKQLTGGTFTVNNYGVFGVDGSAPIINHPQAAILGIGRILERPWVVDSRLEVRRVAQLSLAFDHRVCDGGSAGGFLRFVADCLEDPARALVEL